MNIDGRWVGWGVGDIDPKVTEFKRFLARKFSYAADLDDTQVYDQHLEAVVREMQRRYGDLTVTGVIDYRTQVRMGFIKPVIPRPRFPIQGVGHNTTAFLNPDPFHTFVQATDEGATEALRLFRENPGPVVALGYSMGGVTVQKFLTRLSEHQRDHVKAVITFGDPSMPAEGSLLGNPSGEGISRLPQPDWVRDRYYSFSISGDWYPEARGLLFLLYEVLTRAALTIEFALWLFTQFPTRAMQELMGGVVSDDPLAGVLGKLAPFAGRAATAMDLMRVLPDLMFLLFDAIKFVASNAHGNYGNPQFALWDGLTAVDKAAQIIRERVPEATLYLFPGTWATWNQGFPFDTAVRLQ